MYTLLPKPRRPCTRASSALELGAAPPPLDDVAAAAAARVAAAAGPLGAISLEASAPRSFRTTAVDELEEVREALERHLEAVDDVLAHNLANLDARRGGSGEEGKVGHVGGEMEKKMKQNGKNMKKKG